MFVKGKELHIVWCDEDVKHRARENDTPITEKESVRALHLMLDNHDCDFGITWASVDYAISTILGERKEKENET